MAHPDPATDSTPRPSSGPHDATGIERLAVGSSAVERTPGGTGDPSRAEGSVHPSFLSSAVFSSMPVTLHVGIPIDRFRLETLAALRPGSVVKTQWPGSEDMPVSSGSIRIAWAEFATTDDKRSVRVTRVA